MSRRAKEPVADEARTRRLGLPELMVQAGLGDDSSYYVFPNPGAIIQCPNCGSLAVKIHTSRTRVLQDILPQAQGAARFVELHFQYKSYLCPDCQTVFTPAYQFAAPKSRVTRRFEDFLVRESINRSLEKVSDIARQALSAPAIKLMTDRWVQDKESTQPPLYTPQTLCLLSYERPQALALLVLAVEGGQVYLTDVLPDAGTDAIRTYLRRCELPAIHQVLLDMTETVWETVSETLPRAAFLVDPGFFYTLVREQLRATAGEKMRWLPMPDKMEVILTPRKKILASQQYTLQKALARRRELVNLYDAMDSLYEILTTNWSEQRLRDWADTICTSGPAEVAPIARRMLDSMPNICLYEKAGFPAMKFSSIGEQMASLAASLRPCSFTLEKARLLYLNTPDTIQVEGRPARRLGVPIEKVFTTLRELKQEQERIFEL